MASEKKFIQKALSDFAVKEFLQRELENAGVSSIDIQKTPIAMRIAITVRRPGLVVGKKGQTIKDICDVLQKQYNVENPQIEVIEVQNPSLDAKLMAEKIGKQLEIKGNVKTAMRFALREIMSSGAIGAEIRAAGKLVGKGGKAKSTTVRAGFLKKSGNEAKKLSVGHFTAYLKAGAVGITVTIVPGNTDFSDKVDLSKLTIPPEAPGTDASAITQTGQKSDKKEEKKKRTSGPRKRTTKPKPTTGTTEKTPEQKQELKPEQNATVADKPAVEVPAAPEPITPSAPTPAPAAAVA